MTIADDIEAAVPALHRYARSLVPHRQDADDLVQDCLERALAHPAPGSLVSPGDTRFGAPGEARPVLPWLFTMLHNLSVSRWRTLRRRGAPVDVEEAGLSVPPNQEGSIVRRDLLRAFERLSAEHRQVLLLVGVEGLAYREAAQVLGIPVGTVMSRLSRARDGLRAQMDGAGHGHLRRIA